MADAKKIVGGLGKVTKALLADGEEAVTAAQRAEAGRKAAALIKSQPQVKASEALGQQMEKGMKRTTTTQADRTRVGGGNIGGAPFSAISEADPAYAGKVWGVMDEGTAARLKNLTDPETAWTTMLGSANQLKTNPIVFDKLKRGFIDSMKQGNLSPELAGKINHNLELTFGAGADIRDPKIWRQADTFEKRAALADVMMGQGITPKKGGVAIGGEKSGKGVIFRPTDILKRETEPSLLHTEHGGDVPTFAAGPRLFKLEKESVYRPDLHPGFPTLLTGKDLDVNMIPTPTEIYLPEWHKQFKKNNPNRKPGYYDLALGVKGEGLPSQDLNDEYIRHLLREGFKKGGAVDIDAADRRLSAAIQKRMAKGGKVDIEAADARLADAIAKRTGMAEGGEVGFKKIQFMADGGKLVKGLAKVGKKLMADDVLPAAEREANLAKMLAESKVKDRLYHGTGRDIKEFDKSKLRRTAFGEGFHLAESPNLANFYANQFDEGQNVMSVHAAIKNPYDLKNMHDWYDVPGNSDKDKTNFLKSQGYDGIKYPHGAGGDKTSPSPSVYVAFEPTQIKSAIGNRGTYNIEEADITKADGGKIIRGLGKVGKKLLADAPAESKIIQAPSIVIPKGIGRVKEAVRAVKGDYGARRIERAADEIPNLEKMYKEEALRQAFSGDNAKAVMTMNPAEFENYASKLHIRNVTKPDSIDDTMRMDKMSMSTEDYLKYLRTLPEGFDDVPYLQINKQESGLPLMPYIHGHEGRHRNRTLAGSGEKNNLVQLLPSYELREPLPRRSQEEYIEALKEELAMTKNKVKPEKYFDNSLPKNLLIERPPIDLPDIYAKGGKIVKGGLNVAKRLMADNPLPAIERDANLAKFLEPSKIPQRLYHGTTATEGGKGQEAIRRIKPSKEGALGSGVYTTPNTPHASSYTGIPNDEALAMMSQGNDYTKKMADQFMADRASGRLREGQAGGNMLPVHVQMRNPLIIGKSGRNIDPAADALMSLGMDEASAIKLVERAFEEKGNIGKQIQSRAQAQGYDGIMQYRGDDLSEVVSYNPNAVKSAIGNRGTYDINEPDLSKAHGGLTMASGGSIQENLKNIQNYSVLDKGATRKPNELGGVVLAGASWMAGDEKTKLAKQLFGEEVTNTAVGGQKTSDVLDQLNIFERDGGTFAPHTTVVLDVGANDIAQGVDEETIRNNLNEIVSRLGGYGVNVILSGQPEAHSYDEAIKSTTLRMDDLYSDIAANNPNVTLVDAMSGMLNDKSLMDESGFHLNSDEAKLAYLNQFADAYKGMNTTNQNVVDIPKQIEQITQTGNVVDIPQQVEQVAQTKYPVDIPQEIAQITQVDKPEERYTPEAQVDFTPAVIEREPSAGYSYAQQNQGLDNYYQVINDYLAQERSQDEIKAAMEQYGVSQADIDSARDFQPSGGKIDETYATESYSDGGAAFKKLQFMDKGGITTSAGSFSPEELGVSASDLRVMDEKTWNNIKRNAPEVYEWAKQNVKDEASQLKSAKGVKDFALRTGAQYLGGIPDLINLGLLGVDAVADTNLFSEKPWFGSEQYIDALKRSGAVGENEFPIAETIAGVLAPASLIKKGIKKVGNMRPAKEAPKKRQGGLSAMAR